MFVCFGFRFVFGVLVFGLFGDLSLVPSRFLGGERRNVVTERTKTVLFYGLIEKKRVGVGYLRLR